jgi:hypothetical protein
MPLVDKIRVVKVINAGIDILRSRQRGDVLQNLIGMFFQRPDLFGVSIWPVDTDLLRVQSISV